MKLEYDPASEDFILTTPGPRIRRVHIDRAPTLENALAAFEVLAAMRAAAPRNVPARPDGLKARTEEDKLVNDFIARGGHVTVSAPYIKEQPSRLKPEAVAAKSGAELLAILGLNKREVYVKK